VAHDGPGGLRRDPAAARLLGHDPADLHLVRLDPDEPAARAVQLDDGDRRGVLERQPPPQPVRRGSERRGELPLRLGIERSERGEIPGADGPQLEAYRFQPHK
jgi:hypothetical protein